MGLFRVLPRRIVVLSGVAPFSVEVAGSGLHRGHGLTSDTRGCQRGECVLLPGELRLHVHDEVSPQNPKSDIDSRETDTGAEGQHVEDEHADKVIGDARSDYPVECTHRDLVCHGREDRVCDG